MHLPTTQQLAAVPEEGRRLALLAILDCDDILGARSAFRAYCRRGGATVDSARIPKQGRTLSQRVKMPGRATGVEAPWGYGQPGRRK